MDANGFMHVHRSHISKACVCPYYGREIPNYEELGLDADTVYSVLRPEDELIKAVPSFNGLPLLLEHHYDDAKHPSDFRVGSLGTNAAYNAPFLDNAITITDAEAIKAVENGEAAELSCCYSYDPVLESGEFDGEKYQVRMTNIIGNHCALTYRGRCGSEVRVADSNPMEVNNTMEEEVVKSEEVKDSTLQEFLASCGLNEEQISKAMELASPKEEEVKDEEEVVAEAPVVEEVPLPENPVEAAEEVVEAVTEALAETPVEITEEPQQLSVDEVVKEAEKAMDSKYRSISDAVDACRPVLGNVSLFAFDSAEAVYAEGLKAFGIDASQYPTSALKGMYDVASSMKAKDTALTCEIHPAFAGLNNIKHY